MSFLSSLASLVEFLNEEKSSLLTLVDYLKQTENGRKANFIYFAIYLFLYKHRFKLKLHHFHTSRVTHPQNGLSTF